LPLPSDLEHQNSVFVLSLPVSSNNTDTDAPFTSTVDVSAMGICKGEAGCIEEARSDGLEGNEEKEG